ncbi:MAG: fatty acid desaturase [Betaproteobacteria bacterium]|nr:fatty acid desaturase [Betaproteobacteria bacterium]
MFLGVFDLPWWGAVAVALGLTHVTIAAVTIFLHRHQAHRALELHPVVSHFFRFWLWLTTGMVTKEWAAVHRKHHAHCETPADPHSPQVLGIRKVLWQGAEVYRQEARNPETLEKYGHGTPDDWLERHVYGRHTVVGIGLMLAIDLVLFGPIGLSIWGVQMLWIPLTAAGVINGIGHYWGYRNFSCNDASTNIVPWGILIGGEELHNNHHAYGTSAKLSSKWYEFDIGWLYIRILSLLRLATVKKVAPKIHWTSAKAVADLTTLHAVITHRYDVMTKFARSVKKTYRDELEKLACRLPDLHDKGLKSLMPKLLHLEAKTLAETEKTKLLELIGHSTVLQTVYTMRQELTALWDRSTASKEQLLKQLQDWCLRAEGSGIDALRDFSRKLRCYA